MNLCWAEWNSDCSLDGATRGMALDSLPYVRWITTTSVANHILFPTSWLRWNRTTLFFAETQLGFIRNRQGKFPHPC
jgi:hypothetical protein